MLLHTIVGYLLVFVGACGPAERREAVLRDEGSLELPGDFLSSETESSIRRALALDPSYADGISETPSREEAILAWKAVLADTDVQDQNHIFALWRIASLNAYNFDPREGDAPRWSEAGAAFEELRRVDDQLVSIQTLNAATVWSSLPGAQNLRDERLATAFNWLYNLDASHVDNSVPFVGSRGDLLSDELLGIARRSPDDQRRQLLNEQLAYYQSFIADKVTERIQYGKEVVGAAALLDAIESTANNEQMRLWRQMLGRIAGGLDPRNPSVKPDEQNRVRADWWTTLKLQAVCAACLAGWIVFRRARARSRI